MARVLLVAVVATLAALCACGKSEGKAAPAGAAAIGKVSAVTGTVTAPRADSKPDNDDDKESADDAKPKTDDAKPKTSDAKASAERRARLQAEVKSAGLLKILGSKGEGGKLSDVFDQDLGAVDGTGGL